MDLVVQLSDPAKIVKEIAFLQECVSRGRQEAVFEMGVLSPDPILEPTIEIVIAATNVVHDEQRLGAFARQCIDT